MPAENKRLIEAQDLYRFQLISTPRISPDGQNVVYAQHRIDQKTEKKYTNLWMVSTQNPFPRQFTFGDQSDSSPRWSPDNQQIAFLSNRGDKDKPAKIYLIPVNGGEARVLTSIAGSINGFEWSPDGKSWVCTVRKTDAEVLEREKDENKKKLGVVDRHYNRLFYKLDGFGYLPQERQHLWVVDAATGEARQITDHPVFDEESPAWSPDGQTVAFISNRSPDPDLRPDAYDLFCMPVQGGEIRRVPTPPGPKDRPSFSPDGKWIAYYGTEGEGLGYKNTDLWVVPADGSTEARNLTAPFDLEVGSSTINDVGDPETVPPIWAVDSQSIYFPEVYHGSSILKKISLDGKRPELVIGDDGVAASFNLDRTQAHMAYYFGRMDDPCQVMLHQMESGETSQLTQLNRELLDQIELSQVKEMWIQGPDGNDLHGWIMTPPGFDPSQKYPSILEIHGGPRTQYGFFFMHEFYYLASKGFVVHFCNPRGGRGYGEAHTRAIWLDWGGADYADLMAWTDRMEQEPYIDSDRMGVIGGSYGGYMTVWIIGHTRRFAAAVPTRCVSNFISMWGSSDFNWVFQQEIQDKPPFEDLANFWKHSPIAYIGNARTPTLVIHNENDHRCPIEQGEQVFVALKKLGVDTEFVRFPEEFHGLSRDGRTDRRVARLNHILRWFEKYLKLA